MWRGKLWVMPTQPHMYSFHLNLVAHPELNFHDVSCSYCLREKRNRTGDLAFPFRHRELPYRTKVYGANTVCHTWQILTWLSPHTGGGSDRYRFYFHAR